MLRYLDSCIATPRPVNPEKLLKARVLAGLAICAIFAMLVILVSQVMLGVEGFQAEHHAFLALGCICLLLTRFTHAIEITARLMLVGILVYFTYGAYLSGGLTSFLIPGLLVYPLACAILAGLKYAPYWIVAGLVSLIVLGINDPDNSVPMSDYASDMLHMIGMLLGAGAIAVLALIYEGSKNTGFRRLEHQRKDAEELSDRISELLISVNYSIVVISQEVSAIARRSHETAGEMRAQSEFANEIHSGMGELRQQVAENAGLSKKLAEDAASSGELASESVDIMDASNKAMAAVSDQVTETGLHIDELNRRSSEISEIVTVIQAVAEQTNLLALNAAIEAARAGEHGRGFAVVADEVRQLAERTHRSSGEISEKVSGILSITHQAQESMRQVSELASRGRDSSNKSNEAVGVLLDTSNEIDAYLSGLSESSESQNALNKTVTERFDSIRTAIERRSPQPLKSLKRFRGWKMRSRLFLNWPVHLPVVTPSYSDLLSRGARRRALRTGP